MPTLTNRDAIQAMQGLEALSRVRLPVAGALRVRKVTKALKAHLEDVEAVRMQLLEDFCKKDENGKLVIADNRYQFVSPKAEADFETQYGQLMTETWEHGYSVRISDLGSGEIEPAVLIALGDLLEEGEGA